MPVFIAIPGRLGTWQRPSLADVVPGQSDSSFAERRTSIGHQVTANDTRSRETEEVRWLNTRYSYPKSRHIAPAKPTSVRFLLVRLCRPIRSCKSGIAVAASPRSEICGNGRTQDG